MKKKTRAAKADKSTQKIAQGIVDAEKSDSPTKKRSKDKSVRISRAQRRAHLDERHRSLLHRLRILEDELHRLESRFYRVCIFGSARIKPDNQIYKDVIRLAQLLANKHIDILTGGGPGLMEAANKGAQVGRTEAKSKSRSFGLSIELEWEPVPNPHLDVKRHHHRFSSRLDDFMRLSHSIVCTPGGIGTVLELLFAWQLIQVKHMAPRPILLLDRSFWEGYLEWMKKVPLERGLVSEEDFNSLTIVDTPEEADQIITAHYQEFLKERPLLEAKSKEFS